MEFLKKLALFAILLLILGCAGATKVRDLNANPQKYNGKVVTVKGRVIESYSLPIISFGVARIDDGSGEIWVKPHDRSFFEGEKVTVKGVLKIGMTLGSKSFGYMVVEEPKEKKK
ncbi:MAG: hypothetical protein HUU32_00035 [Calditrichaceae bacterium]|nr:hypothetical protein [Calditrichia bacterium]NUQ39759.1 hypothetical protein [Calditrichaceae bacterium]